jgi:hypothetical protein
VKIAWWWGIMVCLMASGCAMQERREKLFQPEATNPPNTRSIFVTEYAAAMTEAQAAPNKTNIVRLVDAGSAVSAVSCSEWIDRDILAAQGIVASDHTLGVLGALATMAAGAFGLSPEAVAAVGAVQLAGSMFGQVVKSGLGAPESFQTQSTLLASLASCSDKLMAQAQAGGMSFSQAIIGVDRCRRFCSPGAASAITTQAITGVEVDTAPSGRLMLRRPQ